MAPLWVARIAKLHRKVSKIEACPPFASWASGFGLEITWFWAKTGMKFEWRPFFCCFFVFFFCSSSDFGRKWEEIWVWQFQILIYVPFKFSEVSATSLFKILRTLLMKRYWFHVPKQSNHIQCCQRLVTIASSIQVKLGCPAGAIAEMGPANSLHASVKYSEKRFDFLFLIFKGTNLVWLLFAITICLKSVYLYRQNTNVEILADWRTLKKFWTICRHIWSPRMFWLKQK